MNRPQTSAPAISAPPSQPSQAVRGRAIFRKRAGFAKTCMVGASVSVGFGGGEACGYAGTVAHRCRPSPASRTACSASACASARRLCFACMGALIKLSAEHGAHLSEIAFYRFAFGLPPLLVWIALTRSFGAWRTQRPLAHLWRGDDRALDHDPHLQRAHPAAAGRGDDARASSRRSSRSRFRPCCSARAVGRYRWTRGRGRACSACSS